MDSADPSELEIEQRVEKLACAHCGRHFRFKELGKLTPDGGDQSRIVCSQCGATNEIRSEPRPGLGTQPTARVVGVVED